MSDEKTARLGLPLLQAGQAQKELSHNEALTLLDALVQTVVVDIGEHAPPGDPETGDCWIVGTTPSGAWTGQAHALATWTGGGWRFVPARAGMSVWSIADGANAHFDGSARQIGTIVGNHLVIDGDAVVGARLPAIAGPSGGATLDVEARAAVAAILAALRSHGLIAT